MGLGKSENLGHENKVRILIFGFTVLVIFIYIIVNLFSLQIVNQMVYSRRAQEVARRSTIIPAQRGRIFDRSGEIILADNVNSFSLYLVPGHSEPRGPESIILALNEELGTKIDTDVLLAKIPSRWEDNFQPVEIASGLSYTELVSIAEDINLYPGLYWESRPYRYYNESGSISHIMGYVGSITLEEWQLLYNQGYDNDSIIGKSGIEKIYDQLMNGSNGFYLNTVDVKGRNVSEAQIIPPVNGYDLTLTIDNRIQLLAENALGDRKGSAIVMKPSTGEILAMVSYPNFNPNLFYEDGNQSFKALSLNRDFPFLNRAIQSAYAPASTFKALMTFALLAEGWEPSNEIYCSGSMMLGDREFNCHKKTGHGSLNLYDALAESCNIYFGTIGVDFLGMDKISYYSELLGLGEQSGIDIPGEISGVIPTPEWKEDIFHTPWTGGDTLNASIGQGFLSVTPLQMANMVSIIVNDGILYQPFILKQVIDPVTGTEEMVQEPQIIRDISHSIPSDVFLHTKEAMREVILSGTAQVAIMNNVVQIAGKTGTGEVGLDENFHAWFISYGPYECEDPDERIVVVTQVEAYNENWDWWAIKAADMIYQGYFGNQTYEEVVQSMKDRWVWYAREIELDDGEDQP